METIGERIARLRKNVGMTQVELADACGTTDRTIRLIEKNKQDPHTQLFSDIAVALGVSMDYLYYGEEIRKELYLDNEGLYQLIKFGSELYRRDCRCRKIPAKDI